MANPLINSGDAVLVVYSIFDTFMAGMVRCVYSLKPDLLLKSQMNFTYR